MARSETMDGGWTRRTHGVRRLGPWRLRRGGDEGETGEGKARVDRGARAHRHLVIQGRSVVVAYAEHRLSRLA